jgi:thiol-disulfide isomerase/thioredoxin
MPVKSSLCLLLLSLAGLQLVTAKESSVMLTSLNFEEKTAGKTVFVKFFSPTCKHCQALVADWDRMAREWVDHKQGLVGAFDCSKEVKFCDELKITGLPTLLYGEPASLGLLLQEYRGDKTYSELSKFANSTLENPICSPVNLDACNEKDRRQMMYFLSLGTWELGAVINDQLDAIQMAKDKFQADFDSMQSAFDQMGTDYELFRAKTQSKIKMLENVLASRKTE